MDDIWSVIIIIVWGVAIGSVVASRVRARTAKTHTQNDSLMLLVAQSVITDKAFAYIQRGYILEDEYQNLRTLFHMYQNKGGNGMAERMMMEVDRLPVKNSRYAKTAGDIVLKHPEDEHSAKSIIEEIASVMPNFVPSIFPGMVAGTAADARSAGQGDGHRESTVGGTDIGAGDKSSDSAGNKASDGAGNKADDKAMIPQAVIEWMRQMTKESGGI